MRIEFYVRGHKNYAIKHALKFNFTFCSYGDDYEKRLSVTMWRRVVWWIYTDDHIASVFTIEV
jgi:hypothetical protein